MSACWSPRVIGLTAPAGLLLWTALLSSSAQLSDFQDLHSTTQPHFVIDHPDTNERLCFNIHGAEHQAILELVDDPITGISLLGEIYDISVDHHQPTIYFSEVTIQSDQAVVVLNKQCVNVNGARYEWDMSDPYLSDSLIIYTISHDVIHVMYANDDVSFIINRRHSNRTGSFLGIYMQNVNGLSEETTGLLGQFIHADFQILHSDQDEDKYATVNFFDRTARVPVSYHTIHDHAPSIAQENNPQFAVDNIASFADDNIASLADDNALQGTSNHCWMYTGEAQHVNDLLGETTRYFITST